MPSVGLNITVDAQNKAGKALDKAEAQVAKLRKQLGKLSNETEKTANKSVTLRSRFRSLRERVAKLKMGFAALAVAVGGAFLVKGIQDAASFQAKLSALGDNVDQTRNQFRELQKASGNAFSLESLVAAQSKIKAFGLSLKLTPKLLETLTAKAYKMGITPAAAIDSLITGLARSSIQILDNIGVTLKLGSAKERYAASIGKAVSQLSDL